MYTILIWVVVALLLLLVLYLYKYFTARTVIYFYKPGCEGCKEMDVGWDQFASSARWSLSTFAQKVECDSKSLLCREYNVVAVPSIWRDDKKEYDGVDRTASAIWKFALS